MSSLIVIDYDFKFHNLLNGREALVDEAIKHFAVLARPYLEDFLGSGTSAFWTVNSVGFVTWLFDEPYVKFILS